MRKTKLLKAGIFFLAAFVLWTAALCTVDRQPIGPMGSYVGFACINRLLHELTGVHMTLYNITDWLSLVPIGFVAGFAGLGILQWIQRRSILKVDRDILLLGVFYFAVLVLYVFFETKVINYRPVLIEGKLEASYPSSTTMLVLCVMLTGIRQLIHRIRNNAVRKVVLISAMGYAVFMVIGRTVSGVHWLSDIVGGILLSVGLVMLYCSLCAFCEKE